MNDSRNGDNDQEALKQKHDEASVSTADPAQETEPQGVRAEQKGSDETAEPAASSAIRATADQSKTRAHKSHSGRSLGWFAVIIAMLALVLGTQPFWPWQIPGLSQTDDSGLALIELQTELRQSLRQAEEAQQQQAAMLRTVETRVEDQREALQAMQNASDMDQANAEFEARLDTGLTELQTRIGQLQGDRNTAEAALNARVDSLEAQTLQRLDEMNARVDSVGEDLDDSDRNLRERLILVQIEALLTLGQDRLELDDDVAGASLAWQRAADRLQTLDAPAFEPLRQSIEREQRLIEQYRADQSPALSVGQRFNQLNQMADQVNDWPTRGPVDTIQDAGVTDEATPDGWGARVGQALSGLVRIENVEQAAPSALEAEQARSRIQSGLRAAALASARQDWALNRLLIESVEDDIQATLNTTNTAVERALAQLELLKTEPQAAALPLLGEAHAQVLRWLERSQ